MGANHRSRDKRVFASEGDSVNQQQIVLSQLKKRRKSGITALDMVGFGVMRLAARIEELRNQGHVIRTDMEEGINQYGNKTRYGKYVLVR